MPKIQDVDISKKIKRKNDTKENRAARMDKADAIRSEKKKKEAKEKKVRRLRNAADSHNLSK